MTPRKILIEMPMTEIPEKDGLYLVDSPDGKFEAYWNERFSFHEEFIDCSGITSWFKEVEFPSADEISKAAKISCKGNSHTMRYIPMLNQFKSGANYIISKLTIK